MDIKTKFNPGDAIFFLEPKIGKVVTITVRGFRIELLPQDKDRLVITYLCNDEPDKEVNIKVDEEKAFASKSELIKSL